MYVYTHYSNTYCISTGVKRVYPLDNTNDIEKEDIFSDKTNIHIPLQNHSF